MSRMIRALVLVVALSTTSCAWFQKLHDDPIAALQEGTSYVQFALNLAKTAFEIWAAANQATATNVAPEFRMITGNVERGLLVAQDGLRLAADARGPAPDTTALLHDAQTAMSQLHTFLANLPGSSSGLPMASPHSLMNAALTATERAARPRAR